MSLTCFCPLFLQVQHVRFGQGNKRNREISRKNAKCSFRTANGIVSGDDELQLPAAGLSASLSLSLSSPTTATERASHSSPNSPSVSVVPLPSLIARHSQSRRRTHPHGRTEMPPFSATILPLHLCPLRSAVAGILYLLLLCDCTSVEDPEM